MPKTNIPPKPEDMSMTEWINANESGDGGFTRAFLESIGVGWPAKKGWRRKIRQSEGGTYKKNGKPKKARKSKANTPRLDEPGLSYEERNAFLRSLGYKDYRAYTASALWKKIRAEKLKNEPNCESCFEPARQVHHIRYTRLNLLGSSDYWLASVCRRCHVKAELTRDGEKKTLSRSQSDYLDNRRREKSAYYYMKWLADPMDQEYRAILEED